MIRSGSSTGVVWFRRDLRLQDNPAWNAATGANDYVVALFVLEQSLLDRASVVRRDQLLGHLRSLDRTLRANGGCLVLRWGPASTAIPTLVAETGAAGLYFNRDDSPFSVARDQAVTSAVGVPVHRHDGHLAHEPGRVLTKKGTISQVFTPFYNSWKNTPFTPWPRGGDATIVTLDSADFPRQHRSTYQPSGEQAAWERLTRWLDLVDDYSTSRDLPSVQGTSELSADLKFGTISPRTIVDLVGSGSQGREAFIRQIAWRDWWGHIMTHAPGLATGAIKPAYDTIEWLVDREGFERWSTGMTGYPIVDAGIRQLRSTGWMHNRVRMITASFLVKDLLVDWRKGERFFRHHLVDADLAQNAGNWQWVAGTGFDAAPYFRVFNPTSQSAKFDPTGAYIRRWVPELAMLPAPAIHNPGSVGPLELAAAGVALGGSYPTPVVEHGLARLRAIDAYKRALRLGAPRAD